MATPLEYRPIAAPIQSLLDRLRLRIRGYLWVQGIAAIVIASGLAFWATLAMDWLVEPPWQFRAVVLVVVAIALAYVLYRQIFRMAFRPLQDISMAVLLERHFPDYRDSLLTTVELGARPDRAASFSQEMLGHTEREALRRSQGRRLAPIFRLAPLLRTVAIAVVILGSVAAMVAYASPTVDVWLRRVVMLDRDLLWPRTNHVRVQGFSDDRSVKVARGSDYEVIAVADLTGRYKLPENVELRYRNTEGIRGRDNMVTVGVAGPADAEQKYSYLFKGIMSPITFDVVGGDDRDRGLRIEVVDSPVISHMELECEFPPYTHRASGRLPASGVVQLPQGTKVTVHCQSNKDLDVVPITLVRGETTTVLTDIKLPDNGDRRQFSVEVPELSEDTTLLFDLHDSDGIRSHDPVRLVLTARPDDVPVVGIRLNGISTAITAQAQLPVVGQLTDDYGLSRAWFEYQLETGGKNAGAEVPPLVETFHTAMASADGQPRAQVNIESKDGEVLDLVRMREVGELLARRGVKSPEDFAKITAPAEAALLAGIKTQQQIDAAVRFLPQPNQRLILAVKAADNCALPAGENMAAGERYQLDIVTPEQLLSMLEGRELMLRRRFEVIYQEMSDTRDLLARIDFRSADPSSAGEPDATDPGEASKAAAREPGDSSETLEETGASATARANELRELRAGRAIDNTGRGQHETSVVADSFDDIRQEMVNNRVDTPELQLRLKDQIADPLKQIAGTMFPALGRTLQELKQSLDDPRTGEQKRHQAVAQADAILVQMKLVLDKMLELETFNEVVDTLRQIIDSQERLNNETLERQKEQLKKKLRGLED